MGDTPRPAPPLRPHTPLTLTLAAGHLSRICDLQTPERKESNDDTHQNGRRYPAFLPPLRKDHLHDPGQRPLHPRYEQDHRRP